MLTKSEKSLAHSEVRLSRRRQWAAGQAISFLMQQAVENPHVISLAAGLVDSSSLPIDETRDVLRTVLDDQVLAQQALQYGTTQGSERLRKEVGRLLGRTTGCPTAPSTRERLS